MTGARLYLDHAATSPLRSEARAAIERCWSAGPGNPASSHAEGHAARGTLAEARARVAELVGAHPEEVFFTAGATEASNLAVRGVARALEHRPRHVISTRIEHPATKRACEVLAVEGWRITLLRPDRLGRLDAEELGRMVPPGVALVSVIAGHNEIGTVQPLERIAESAHAAGALLHLDAVQIAGVQDLSPVAWDLLSLSAHKLGGPVGVGALMARDARGSGEGPAVAPLLVGGVQERGVRPGTVPVALAAGFGAAAAAARSARSEEARRWAALRDRLTRGLFARRPDLVPLGCWRDHPDRALPHLAAFGIEGIHGDELVDALDEAGVAAASSSACLGDRRSHVLDAIGLHESVGFVRFSLGWSTSEEEIDAAIGRIAAAIERVTTMAPFERRRRRFAARAEEVGLGLTAAHWEVAETVFDFYQREGVLPGARHLARALGPGARIEGLYPGGMQTLASWLGVPVPQGGCRPAGV